MDFHHSVVSILKACFRPVVSVAFINKYKKYETHPAEFFDGYDDQGK